MPELPEVETIARQLNEVLPRKIIREVEVRRNKSFQGSADQLIGKTIKRVGRKAKMIVVSFKTGPSVLLIHLKMTGQLIYQEHGNRIVGGHPTADWVNELPSSHTRVMVTFTDGAKLYFNDQRVFGWWRVIDREDWMTKVTKLPPDVVDTVFTTTYLKSVLKRSTRAVKLVLLDQDKIGGLGNIYVNDALWLSQTKPTRSARTLTDKEISKLHKAAQQVIRRGIETGGASESTYRHINGLGGKYQDECLVYKREGQPCLRPGCRGIIEKVRLGGRGTYFCPVCQH